MDITTPSLPFSAISMLLSAYNGRYLTLSRRIREFHVIQVERGRRGEKKEEQIKIFRYRLELIKKMQIYSVLSLLFSTASIMAILIRRHVVGEGLFAIGLILFLISLYFTLKDIIISTEHLKILKI